MRTLTACCSFWVHYHDTEDTYNTKLVFQILSNKLYEYTLHEKCPYSEFFWSAFSHIRTVYEEIRSKYGPEKLRIRRLFYATIMRLLCLIWEVLNWCLLLKGWINLVNYKPWTICKKYHNHLSEEIQHKIPTVNV